MRLENVPKKRLNDLSMDKLEALLSEEMEEMSLFDCSFNWFCSENNSK